MFVSRSALIVVIVQFYSKITLLPFQKSAAHKHLPFTRMLYSGIVLHALSLLSSSFVEEEHQTFYFYIMTMEVIFVLLVVYDFFNRNYNMIHGNITTKSKAKSHWKENFSAIKLLLACFLLMVLSRIVRALNQTGDKWAHLTDLGDWLMR